jgi:hypothetical protein
MPVIHRIKPASAFKVGFLVAGFFGLFFGVLCTVGTIVGASVITHAHGSMGNAGAYVGLFAVILCPLIFGAIGGALAAIGALLYNVASAWFGGLEVDTQS